MWVTCALVSALSTAPAQAAAPLKLSNVRPTVGLFGPTRRDKKYLPGDMVWMRYDIENLQVDPRGKAEYELTLECVDGKGARIFQNGPEKYDAFMPLGGNVLPGEAHTLVGLSTQPGKYTLKITVTDKSAKPPATQSFAEEFEVQAKGFGITNPQLSYRVVAAGAPPVPAPPVGVVGQGLELHFVVVGIARDMTSKQADLTVEVRIYDQNNATTTKEPFAHTFKQLQNDLDYLDFHWPLDLNRAGKFTLELNVADGIGKKKDNLKIPFTVLEPVK